MQATSRSPSATFPPCDGAPPDLARAKSVEKGHGRVETREIAVTSEAVEHLQWPGAAQIIRVERRRWIRGRESVEIAYFVTSLTREEAAPERLLALAREHWAIENKLHHVRDVSLNEDRCRVRAGAMPLATLRNLVLTLIRRAGMHVPEARENFREDRAAAIAAVTGRIF